MALFPRIRLRALMLHVRDTLRTGLNAQITAAIAESQQRRRGQTLRR